MKKYRIVYQCNAYTSEHYVRAADEDAAMKKFAELKGENTQICKIEEVTP